MRTEGYALRVAQYAAIWLDPAVPLGSASAKSADQGGRSTAYWSGCGVGEGCRSGRLAQRPVSNQYVMSCPDRAGLAR
ncbi:protein of unknown function (plasmid) [Cupriavidus taiwanensis]|uniref:Uncharacterized protein n=1 Tax=Cupriavidus taiwanensis TaxID=164546 RepID=A0A375DV05_9BURK|nr:hypothetical protein CBM2587_P10053 [Cupriavidus taiwanensis]SOZ18834.1 hypothetical protein CBM2597_U30006 [Cupriavidus taiwanensis]SOZ96947.1 hypothetical protein CBM2598_U30006 [Cupriavidus taiwanensis]SPC25974.1 hypothetical protein CBM2594_U20161 [Cupriavidus taiwanensis]SPD37999.1 protein of unknown function [Cupriavidus taiwanensis]